MKLGFIPPELEADPVKKAIVAPAIGAVLEQLSKVGVERASVNRS